MSRLLLCFLVVSWLSGGELASAREASFTVAVPAGGWKALKLAHLPAGASVALEGRAGGRLEVVLLEEDDYRRFPEVQRVLYRQSVEHRFSFRVSVIRSSTHYLVFDNREGPEARTVSITLRGQRQRTAPLPPDVSEAPEEISDETLRGLQARMDELKRHLEEILIFRSFPMLVKRCGRAQAFAMRVGVAVCAEYARSLVLALGDSRKAADALLFTTLHEAGHVLLAQWNYPAHDNEEYVDEFATALMVLLGHRERVQAGVEYFARQASRSDVHAQSRPDDRHPRPRQRAHNLRRWAADPLLVHKWERVLVPHLQTAVLQHSRGSADSPFSEEVLDREMHLR